MSAPDASVAAELQVLGASGVGALVAGVLFITLIAIFKGRAIKVGSLVIGGADNTNKAQADRDRWEYVTMKGFQNFMQDTTPILTQFIGTEITRFYTLRFMDLLKKKGIPETNLRHHKYMVTYETILALLVRKVILPRMYTVFFRNHIPDKADLKSSDREIKSKAKDWYRDKLETTMEDVHAFVDDCWTLDAIPYHEVIDNYTPDVMSVFFPAVINMFERIRTKRNTIVKDMRVEIPNLDIKLASRRWEEIYILMGYNDVLRG